MTEEWAASAQSNRFWQKPTEQNAIKICQHLLERQIAPLQAAQGISSIYISHIQEGDVNSWYPWTIILDAVINIKTDTKNLQLIAQMVRCISRLPEPLDNVGQPVKSDTNAQVFWRDVPGFAYAFRQATPYVLIEDLDQGRNGMTWESASRKLLNANIFAALYLQELDPDGPERDLGSMRKTALDHFMWALEIKTETSGQIRRTEVYIPPVAQWIQLVGAKIYEYCKENRDYHGEDVPQRWMGGPQHGSELLWIGRDGFNIERWAFWKKRFEEISGLQGVTEKVKGHAAQAVKEMAKYGHMDEVMS